MRLLLVVCAWAFAMPGFAQTADEPYTPEPAHVAYIDGSATVTRDGRAEPAALNVPLISGDQLRTREGRAEVLFGDGSVLDVDHFTTVDFLSDELVRLTDGRVRLTVGGRERVTYRIDTPSGAVRIEAPGEYRVSLVGESGRSDVELVTVRGYATLVNELGETTVRAGERAFAAAAMAPSYAQAYNSATWDAFDRWAADRRDERTGTTSAQYLPDEIRGYSGDFDRYGNWQYDGGYGYVWYPRVRVDWRPYYYGRWNYYGPWGWTWIAYDRWGWPTHHYGRWGFRAGAWFWIPSRRWAPAYVYWAGASDYVGWCPLGWDNRPIFNIININVNIGRGSRGYDDPYRAWTVMPRRAFGSHVDVGRYAVARAEIDRAVPRWYVSGASAPIRPALSPRNVAPIYSAGRSSPGRDLPAGPTVSAAPSGAERTAPRQYSAPREYRRSLPGANVPRATPPASAGALGPSTTWQRYQRPEARGQVPAGAEGSEDRARGRVDNHVSAPRARYRDVGPGGSDTYQGLGARDQRSGSGARGERPDPSNDRAPSRWENGVSAPRGVPEGGIYGPRGVPSDNSRGYAPRGVPRDGGASAPPARSNEPAPSYAPPMRRRPEGSGGGGVYAPRPSTERPSYGAAPSGPGPSRPGPSADRPRGGEGRDRAAPRGSSAPSSRPGGGERGHSRRPPR